MPAPFGLYARPGHPDYTLADGDTMSPTGHAGCHMAEFKSDIAKPLGVAIATFTGVYQVQGQNIVQKLINVPALLDEIAGHHRRHRLMEHQKEKVTQLMESARQLSQRYLVPTNELDKYNYLIH